MKDHITAGQVVKSIRENTLNKDKGMHSMWVKNVLGRLNAGELKALELGIQKAKKLVQDVEAQRLIHRMKALNISEDQLLDWYRQETIS